MTEAVADSSSRFATSADVATLYLIPGSPTSWRVWLSLGMLGIPHQVERLSFAAGDTRSPSFYALNARGQVPVLVDRNLVLTESFAIVEYLDEAYGAGQGRTSLWPTGIKQRARARSLAFATDGNLGARVYRPLADQLFLTSEADRDDAAVARAVEVGQEEVAWLESELNDKFYGGHAPSTADFTVYGLLAFIAHIGRHHRQADLTGHYRPKVAAWRRRVEALPFFAETWPAHWPPVVET